MSKLEANLISIAGITGMLMVAGLPLTMTTGISVMAGIGLYLVNRNND